MKKITIFFVMALISLSCFAQIEKAGKFGTEIYFRPWNTNNTFSLIDGVKGRYFINENFAIRTTLNFSINPETSYSYAVDPDIEFKEKNSFTVFGINPGIEYHFANYDRLSLYAGGELRLEFSSAKYTETNDNDSRKEEWKGVNANQQHGGNTLGIGLFTGADFYIYKGLYVGAELGLRFSTTRDAEVTVKMTDAQGVTVEATTKDYDRDTSLRFYCLPAIRLGWMF